MQLGPQELVPRQGGDPKINEGKNALFIRGGVNPGLAWGEKNGLKKIMERLSQIMFQWGNPVFL